jgi:N-formylglutamate amidohydrolase
MKATHTYFKGDYMFTICQQDLMGVGDFNLGCGRYKTGYITLPEGHPATGMHYDQLPDLGVNFSDNQNGWIDFENRWTFGFDTASQSRLKEFQTTSYVKERLDEIYTILKHMEGGRNGY